MKATSLVFILVTTLAQIYVIPHMQYCPEGLVASGGTGGNMGCPQGRLCCKPRPGE